MVDKTLIDLCEEKLYSKVLCVNINAIANMN